MAVPVWRTFVNANKFPFNFLNSDFHLQRDSSLRPEYHRIFTTQRCLSSRIQYRRPSKTNLCYRNEYNLVRSTDNSRPSIRVHIFSIPKLTSVSS